MRLRLAHGWRGGCFGRQVWEEKRRRRRRRRRSRRKNGGARGATALVIERERKKSERKKVVVASPLHPHKNRGKLLHTHTAFLHEMERVKTVQMSVIIARERERE